MDENPISPQQATSSLMSVAPFLWPFVLLSLGVALTPVSPISWSYSTWLLFIIPLIITVFAPTRTFSGPLRYAYLEYASKIASWAVSLLKAVMTNFHSVPTLALPALFFLPVLPIFFFVFFPAVPIVWHYIAYHYRLRLKAITTLTAKTNAKLDLATSRAREAMVLAHTYEKQALYIVSTSRTTPSLGVSRYSTDFGIPEFNNPQRHWRPPPSPGTLGADLAGRVLDTERRMAVIEEASQEVRALSEQAIATATEGDMVAGDKLVENAAQSLGNVVKQVDELRSTANQARGKWVELRRRLNEISASASTTTASLDHALARAREAMALARTYEKQVLHTVSTTRSTPLLGLSRHTTDSTTPEFDESEARWQLVESPGPLGADLAQKLQETEKKMAEIEEASQEVRTLLERAIVIASEGDTKAGKESADSAAESLEDIETQVETMRSTADQARLAWVNFRRRLVEVVKSTSTTGASLDVAMDRAREAMTLARAYENQALYTVTMTRSTPLVAISKHSADFSKPEFDRSAGRWGLLQSPGTLGGDLAAKILDTYKQMAVIDKASQEVRILLSRAVATATEGNMEAGEETAEKAASSSKEIEGEVDELLSIAAQARSRWVDFRQRLTTVTTSASTTTASLDLTVMQARRAATLAHTYEKQALEFVSTTRRSASQTLALHDAHFFATSTPIQQARRTISDDAKNVRTLGTTITDKMSSVEKIIGVVESEAEKIRAMLMIAVTSTADGDVEKGETLTAKAALDYSRLIIGQAQELSSTSAEVRQTWVRLSVEYSTIS